MAQRPDIASLIAGTGAADLGPRLIAQCWPAGSDGRNVVASEWLRRWQPKSVVLPLPHCACASGRCSACG